MKKKILIGLGILVALCAVAFAYLATRPRMSPKATAKVSVDGLDISVSYSSPRKRDRLIFGAASTKALVPYGEYWRLGANEATEISFSKPVTFGGKPVKAGTYTMYAVPGASTWKVVLNSNTSRWGAREPDHDDDVATAEAPVEALATPQENLVIDFAKEPLRLDISWDTTTIHVPLAAQ